MEFDVVIVGAGPAGLASAYTLAQLAKESGQSLSIAVIEKGAEVGAHILSGNVFDPRALDELVPDWSAQGAPLDTAVTDDVVHFLKSNNGSMRVPHAFLPLPMRNDGNYIISLGRLCQWLAEKVEGAGVDIFPGFAASEVLYGDDGEVCGVATSDMGVGKDGRQKSSYQPGYELRGKFTIFAEGVHGNLGKELIQRFNLRDGRDPQHYGIGIKEIWEIDPAKHKPGRVQHSLGWPLDNSTEGGGFLYHAANNQVFVGLIVALNYSNPYLSPFHEFQRLKTHPVFADVLSGGKRLAYGSRAVNKGGLQSLPKLVFPGGVLTGCDAGFLNGAKIKGAHTAIKSGALAAECILEALNNGKQGTELSDYEDKVKASWIHDELHRARNFGPALHKFGTLGGAAFTFVDQNIFRGKLPFTMRNATPDHACLKAQSDCSEIDYPKPDGKLSFDKLSSVFLSSTNHEEDQPSHLRLIDADVPVTVNLPRFAGPSQRFCPAGVYEFVERDGKPAFQINAQNCVHCKTCDIKDPSQNIVWTVPEGGGGPNYSGM